MNKCELAQPGVYLIRNLADGKHYVGSSVNLRRRSREHAYELKDGRHCNPILQHAWMKHGAEAFQFEVVELCSREELIAREQAWMDDTCPVYNINKLAASRLGMKASAATRARISAGKTNPSAQTRERLAQANRDRGPEVRQRMSDAARARAPASESTRSKLADAGRDKTPEHLEKLRVAAAGRRHTDEARALMSAAALGREISPEQRLKLRTANLGKRHSEETKQKMRDTRRRIAQEKLKELEQ